MHHDVEAARARAPAIGRIEADVAVVAGRVEARRPGEYPQARVKLGAGWQAVEMERHRVAIGVAGAQAERDRFSFAAADHRRQRIDHRRAVAARNGDGEALGGEAAAGVVGPQHHVHLVGAVGVRLPGECAAGRIHAHPLRAGEQQVGGGDAVGIDGARLVAVGLARRRLHRRIRLEHRHAVGVGQRVAAVGSIRPLLQRIGERDRLAGGRLARSQQPVRQIAAEIDQPEPVLVAQGGGIGPAGEGARLVERQQQRHAQLVGGAVGDAHVVGDRAGATIRTAGLKVEAQQGGEVLHAQEASDKGRAEAEAQLAAHRRRHLDRVIAGLEGPQAHEQGAAGRVVAQGFHIDCLAVPPQGEVAAVGHRAGGALGAHHVLVEADRQLAQRQRHQRQIGRIGGNHLRRQDGGDHIDPVGVGDQQAPVGGGQQGLRSRAAARQFQPLQRHAVDHPQARPVRIALARAGAHEQQPLKPAAVAAEGDRIHLGVEAQLRLCAAAAVEAEHVAALRPAGAPEHAVGSEGQVVDARVAEMPEAARHRIEALDAVAGRHIEKAAAGVEGECLGEAVAMAGQHRAAAGVELQQRAAAAGGPQLAVAIEDQVEHRLAHIGEGVERAAAVLVEAVEIAAVGTAAHEEAAVGVGQQGERTDAGMALGDAAAEGRAAERSQHPGVLRRGGRWDRGQAGLRLQEQRVGGGRAAGYRRFAHVLAGLPHAGGGAEVGAGAVIWRRLACRRPLAVAGVVGGEGEELVAPSGHSLEHRLAGGALAQPDLPVAAVFRHIDRGVLHAAAAALLGDAPAHVVIGAAHGDRRGRERRDRCGGVEHVAHHGGVEGRLGVEKHPRRGVNRLAAAGAEGRLHRVGNEAGAHALGVVR